MPERLGAEAGIDIEAGKKGVEEGEDAYDTGGGGEGAVAAREDAGRWNAHGVGSWS